MTEVELFWASISSKWPAQPQPSWHELPPQAQFMVINAINMLLTVLNMPVENGN